MRTLFALVALRTLVAARAAELPNIVAKMNRSNGTGRFAVVLLMELQAVWQRQTDEFSVLAWKTAPRPTAGLRP